MPGRLQDKVAIVTGAGSVGPGWGNGRATAVRFAEEGAKIFAVDRITRSGPPYADAVPFARRLVDAAGDRAVWGLDWPHPNHRGPIPDDGQLVDLVAEIAPHEAARQMLLVANPQRLDRFAT